MTDKIQELLIESLESEIDIYKECEELKDKLELYIKEQLKKCAITMKQLGIERFEYEGVHFHGFHIDKDGIPSICGISRKVGDK